MSRKWPPAESDRSDALAGSVRFFLNGFTLSTEALRRTPAIGMSRYPHSSSPSSSPALVLLARQVLPGRSLGAGDRLAIGRRGAHHAGVRRDHHAHGRRQHHGGALSDRGEQPARYVILPPLLLITLNLSGVNMWGTSVNLLLTVLCSTVVGQLANRRWPQVALAFARPIGVVSKCIILCFILLGTAHCRIPGWRRRCCCSFSLPAGASPAAAHAGRCGRAADACGPAHPARAGLLYRAKIHRHHYPAHAGPLRAAWPGHGPGRFARHHLLCDGTHLRQPAGRVVGETRTVGCTTVYVADR